MRSDSNYGPLQERTQEFAVRVIELVDNLPRKRKACGVIGNQLLRSATSVGANYHAARRGRSNAEFLAKLGIVEEEGDECVYWLELLVRAKIFTPRRVSPLLKEANEIVAMVAASIRTAKRRHDDEKGRGK